MLNRTQGGLAVGTLFVLPGVLALLALSAVYVLWQDTALVTAMFAGIAPPFWRSWPKQSSGSPSAR